MRRLRTKLLRILLRRIQAAIFQVTQQIQQLRTILRIALQPKQHSQAQ